MSTLGSLYGHSSSISLRRPATKRIADIAEGSPASSSPTAMDASSSRRRLQVPVIGLRRSGKSSILGVVYNEVHPDDTVFTESTTKPNFILSDSFLPIRIIDTPGRILLGDARLEKGLPLQTTPAARAGPSPAVPGRQQQHLSQSHQTALGQPVAAGAVPGQIAGQQPQDILPWTEISAVVFVIDAQDDTFEALSKLHAIILSAFAENQTIDFHVFVHKIDGYSNDYRQDTLSTIQGKVLDDLVDSSPSFVAQPWSYPEPSPAVSSSTAYGDAAGKSSSKNAAKDRSRSKSKDFYHAGGGAAGGFSRSPAPNGYNSSGGGAGGGMGYDASASEFSAYSGGHRTDVPPEPGLINLDQAVRLHCHATSIYDTSVFVAFSKLQQSLAQKVRAEETASLHVGDETAASTQRHPPSSSLTAGGGGDVKSQDLAGARSTRPEAPTPGPTQTPHPSPPTAGAGAVNPSWSLAESVVSVCDAICASCKFENAFLFDIPTRTYVASDSSPFDTASFDLVFEYAGFLGKFAAMYAGIRPAAGGAETAAVGSASDPNASGIQVSGMPTGAAAGSSAALLSTSPSSTRRFLLGVGVGRTNKESLVSSSASASSATAAQPSSTPPAAAAAGSAGGTAGGAGGGGGGPRFASSVTRLSPDKSLCFWQINHRLSLIALMHSDIHAKHTGLIDYNVTFFRRAVQSLYSLAQLCSS
ncbi:hypothetical protein BCV70DRAFT_200544 [Testicularia cyperi]|uniref:GTP-binding protein n=1 Tax=Testicularia cyperi TaxID=1882483 RepID=A0A317XNE8_9BASI|nr:hypothetical protein BCV70DRAFT_200544 [Testicularia cyperi]